MVEEDYFQAPKGRNRSGKLFRPFGACRYQRPRTARVAPGFSIPPLRGWKRDMHDKPTRSQSLNDKDGPPPLGGGWRTLYAVVLLPLAVLVLIFYLFTRAVR